jgi:hypothetical protein
MDFHISESHKCTKNFFINRQFNALNTALLSAPLQTLKRKDFVDRMGSTVAAKHVFFGPRINAAQLLAARD